MVFGLFVDIILGKTILSPIAKNMSLNNDLFHRIPPVTDTYRHVCGMDFTNAITRYNTSDDGSKNEIHDSLKRATMHGRLTNIFRVPKPAMTPETEKL